MVRTFPKDAIKRAILGCHAFGELQINCDAIPYHNHRGGRDR